MMGIFGSKKEFWSNFFAGVGEVNLFLFTIYVLTGLSPLVGVLLGIKPITSLGGFILLTLGLLFSAITIVAKVYRKYFYTPVAEND